MDQFHKISDIRSCLHHHHLKGIKSGFVPTMGALHKGHFSLIERSKSENDLTISSIYVNSLQFNDPKDYINYPRTLDQDIKLLNDIGCDILFVPEENEIYPSLPCTGFSFKNLDTVMEGKSRPGHFNGVALIVLKLLNIIEPENVYFGQKDLQQYTIINQMVEDLNLPINCVSCPIVRDTDGLALSSRNVLLSPAQRRSAPRLYQALLLAKTMFTNQQRKEKIYNKIVSLFQSDNTIGLEYFEMVDSKMLQPIQDGSTYNQVAFCIAARVGNIRLIDNIIL